MPKFMRCIDLGRSRPLLASTVPGDPWHSARAGCRQKPGESQSWGLIVQTTIFFVTLRFASKTYSHYFLSQYYNNFTSSSLASVPSHRRISLAPPPGARVRLESFNLLAIHMLGNLIGLPFLEAETQAFMTVVLIVGLVLVVFHTNKVAVDRFRIQ
jgi:hypothetical protein